MNTFFIVVLFFVALILFVTNILALEIRTGHVPDV